MSGRQEVVINTLNVHVNRELTRQLKLDRIKIQAGNFTTLNNELRILNSMLNRFGANVTLTELSMPKALTAPFERIWNTMKDAWSALEKGMMIIAGLAMLLVLILSAPLIELTFILLKGLKHTFLKLLRLSRSASTTLLPTRNQAAHAPPSARYVDRTYVARRREHDY